MKNAKHFIVVGVLVLIATLFMRWLLLVVFANPIAASSEALSIDILSNGHYWMISFLFSLIMVLMLYSAVVFRRKPGDEEDGPHIHGNTALEVGWTIIPLIIVIGFGIWGTIILIDITKAEPGEMRIGVEAQQWSWSFEYPEQGDFTSSELVMPVSQPIVLEMRSKDVIHNFWIVEFRVKQDVVPGSTQELRITPIETGEYLVRCAEICGLSHSQMVAPVRVVSQTEFDAWVEEQLAAPKLAEMSSEERGAYWHSPESGLGCSGCHSLDGTTVVGPTWLGIYGREETLDDGTVITVDDAYIRKSILEPDLQIVEGFQNVMQSDFEEQFAEIEAEILANEGIEVDIIADLIAFMKTLEE